MLAQLQLRETEMVSIDAIDIEPYRRALHQDSVDLLAISISKLGLRTPISVRYFAERPSPTGTADSYILIAGAHRLAAAKKLGWQQIECIVLYDEPDEQARLWEIAENLHRAELTIIERSDHIAEWIRLTDSIALKQPAQVAQAVAKHGHKQEGSGISAASRDLGIDRTEAQRAVKIASLTPEAKAVAIEVGLDNNQSVLLAAKDKGNDPNKEIKMLRHERARRDAEQARKVAEKLNNDRNRVVRISVAEEFGNWLYEHANAQEIPTIISWLEGAKGKDIIAFLRQAAA